MYIDFISMSGIIYDMDKNTSNNEEQKPENINVDTSEEINQNNDNINDNATTENKDLDSSTDESSNEESTEDASKPKKFNLKLSKKKTLIIVGLFIILGVATFFVFGRSDSSNKVSQVNIAQPSEEKAKLLGAEVTLLEGTVEISKNGKTWEKLEVGTGISEGDNLRTNANGRAIIALDDGSAIRLNNNSQILIEEQTVKSVVINNDKGEVYTRVVPSTERFFSVRVKSEAFTAKGTAYKTINTDNIEGVEVYHSTVTSKQGNKDVSEGKKLLVKSDQKDQENVISDINIDELKKDEFVIWNAEQDKKETEFSASLGFLKKLEEPAPTAPAKPAPVSQSGIFLSGKAVEYSGVFSWSVKGVNTSGGYKLIKSSKTLLPVYPDNSAAYIEPGKFEYNLSMGDGGTYYFRLCAYRENKTCDSYSNTVTITAAKKPKDPVILGGVNLSISGNMASWTIGGNAPYGYKVYVANSPTIPTQENYINRMGVSGTSFNLDEFGLSSGSYNTRVCKYGPEGGCAEYSDAKPYIKP